MFRGLRGKSRTGEPRRRGRVPCIGRPGVECASCCERFWRVHSPAGRRFGRLRPGAGRSTPTSPTRPCAWTTYHTGRAAGRSSSLDAVVSDGPWPGSRTQPRRRVEPRPLLLRGRSTRRPTRRSTRAASRRSTASGRRPTSRSRASAAASTSRSASPGRSSRFSWSSRSAIALNAFREVWSTVDRPGLALRQPRRPARRREGLDRLRERPGRREGGPAGARRRLRRGGPAEVPRRRETAGRAGCSRPSRSRAARRTSTSARSICPSPRSGVNRPRTGDFRRTRARRLVQHLRLGALRAHARQPRRCATSPPRRRTTSSRS